MGLPDRGDRKRFRCSHVVQRTELRGMEEPPTRRSLWRGKCRTFAPSPRVASSPTGPKERSVERNLHETASLLPTEGKRLDRHAFGLGYRRAGCPTEPRIDVAFGSPAFALTTIFIRARFCDTLIGAVSLSFNPSYPGPRISPIGRRETLVGIGSEPNKSEGGACGNAFADSERAGRRIRQGRRWQKHGRSRSRRRALHPGTRVGLLDVDIHGPSSPMILGSKAPWLPLTAHRFNPSERGTS